MFPALIYRLVKPKVVLLIFVNGRIVLTGMTSRDDSNSLWGAKSFLDLQQALESITPVIELFKKTWTSGVIWCWIFLSACHLLRIGIRILRAVWRLFWYCRRFWVRLNRSGPMFLWLQACRCISSWTELAERTEVPNLGRWSCFSPCALRHCYGDLNTALMTISDVQNLNLKLGLN